LNIKLCSDFPLQLSSEIFLIQRRIPRDVINLRRFSRNVPIFLVKFGGKFNFPGGFSEKYSNIKFNENPSAGTELFHADGQRDRQIMTKLIIAFRSFANAPKNYIHEDVKG